MYIIQQWEMKKVVFIYKNLTPCQRTTETVAVFASWVSHVLLCNRDIPSCWHAVMEVTMETWVIGAEEILRGWRILQSQLCVRHQLCRASAWELTSFCLSFLSFLSLSLPSLKQVQVQVLAAMQEAMNHSVTGSCSLHSNSSTKPFCCFSVYFHLGESVGGKECKRSSALRYGNKLGITTQAGFIITDVLHVSFSDLIQDELEAN